MDVEELRADIPALADGTYLNWGASGPSPRRVVAAFEDALEHQEYESPTAEGMYEAAYAVFDSARESVADLVGAAPSDVALTQSTTDGISRFANALDWTADDEVVITDLEHAAGRLPWRRLQRDHGFDITVFETDAGVIDEDEWTTAVADASLVCFSAVDWLYGRRHPVSDLVDIATDAGAMTLVDAVQVPGQMPMDVDAWGADVVAASGHKWLLGPWGAGFLYVEPSVAETLEPRTVGYRGVEDPYDPDFAFKAGAHRFEMGTTNPAPYAGLDAAIETMQAVGIDRIESRIHDLTAYLKDGLSEERLRSPISYHSGLVSLRAADPEATVERLSDAGVHIRSLPAPETVRISIHAANTEGDLDAVIDALSA